MSNTVRIDLNASAEAIEAAVADALADLNKLAEQADAEPIPLKADATPVVEECERAEEALSKLGERAKTSMASADNAAGGGGLLKQAQNISKLGALVGNVAGVGALKDVSSALDGVAGQAQRTISTVQSLWSFLGSGASNAKSTATAVGTLGASIGALPAIAATAAVGGLVLLGKAMYDQHQASVRYSESLALLRKPLQALAADAKAAAAAVAATRAEVDRRIAANKTPKSVEAADAKVEAAEDALFGAQNTLVAKRAALAKADRDVKYRDQQASEWAAINPTQEKLDELQADREKAVKAREDAKAELADAQQAIVDAEDHLRVSRRDRVAVNAAEPARKAKEAMGEEEKAQQERLDALQTEQEKAAARRRRFQTATEASGLAPEEQAKRLADFDRREAEAAANKKQQEQRKEAEEAARKQLDKVQRHFEKTDAFTQQMKEATATPEQKYRERIDQLTKARELNKSDPTHGMDAATFEAAKKKAGEQWDADAKSQGKPGRPAAFESAEGVYKRIASAAGGKPAEERTATAAEKTAVTNDQIAKSMAAATKELAEINKTLEKQKFGYGK